jgi:hypothetical protein
VQGKCELVSPSAASELEHFQLVETLVSRIRGHCGFAFPLVSSELLLSRPLSTSLESFKPRLRN